MRTMKFLTLLCVVAFVQAALSAQRSRGSDSGKQAAGGQREVPVTQDQRKAFRVGGLEGAAKVTGSVVREIPVGVPVGPRDLSELVRTADLIMVGTPINNQSRLTPDGKMVTLTYEVLIERWIKGQQQSGLVRVEIPGGRVTFADGSEAEVRTPGLRWPMNNRTYVWFLQRDNGKSKGVGAAREKGGAPYFFPTFGPLGIYAMAAETVAPSGAFRSSLGRNILRARLSPEAFVREVTQIVDSGK